MRSTEFWLLNYFLNSLWQVPLVFAAIWIAARAVRPLGLQEEHRMWCGALPFAAVLPMLTVNAHALVDEVRSRLTPWFAHGANGGASVTVAMGDGQAKPGVHISTGWLNATLWLYGAIFAYSLSRLAWGLWQTYRLRRMATALPLDGPVGAIWFRYAKMFGVLADEIATVPDATGPVTVGVSRRILLLPEMWLGSVDAEDIDAAIAHECAHMRRRDFGKNLLYRLMTLPVSYHPAVWLMQSRVVETREMLCDAMAADAVAGRERYARSLLRLAANLVDGGRQPNLHAIGIFDANNFERRVMNLTMKRTDAGRVRRVAIKAVCVILGAGTTVSALALRMQVAAPMSTRQEINAMVAREIAIQSAAQGQSGSQPDSAAKSAPMPESFVMGVPRSETGKPAPVMKVELIPSPTPMSEATALPAPMRIRVLTPAQVETDEAGMQSGDPTARISGGVMAGNILTKVTPVYPQEAKDAKVQGIVVLDAVIGKDGAIKSLRVLSGPNELANSALEAVKQWTYKPYLLNGNPTEVETTITVNYSLAK
jgi:TonB family protein